MKNRILNHFGLKLISLIIAIVIWIIVANVDDYKTTKQISGIEIEFINGDAITEKNKVYEVPEGSTIDIVVKGPRSVLESLDGDDFKAVADLSKMSVTNAVAVEVSAVSSNIARDLTINYSNNAIIIAVEDKIEKQLPITVRANGDVADGYAIRGKAATPNLITIQGAESVVNTVEEVVVDIDVTGASQGLTALAKPVFLNHGGEEVDASKFQYDVEEVSVAVEIMQTKELNVRILTAGEVKEGYAIASVDYQPTSILVVGENADLAKVDEIIIDDIDVSGCNKDLETSIMISDYLPEGIMLVGDVQEIMIKVMIEPVEEKTFSFDKNDINLVGKEEGYQYTITTAASELKIVAKGLSERLDAVKVSSFIPSIDVSGYGPGTYTFNVNLKEITGIELTEPLEIQVEIEAIQ